MSRRVATSRGTQRPPEGASPALRAPRVAARLRRADEEFPGRMKRSSRRAPRIQALQEPRRCARLQQEGAIDGALTPTRLGREVIKDRGRPRRRNPDSQGGSASINLWQ